MLILQAKKIKMYIEKNKLPKIDWSLLGSLFLFIYQPPLFEFNLVFFLIVLLNVISLRNKNSIFETNNQLWKNKMLFYLMVSSLFLIMYLAFIGFFSTIYFRQIYTISLTLILYSYCGFLIAQIFIKKKFTVDQFLVYFVLIGIFQAIISIIIFMFPTLRSNIVDFYIFRGYPKEVYLYMTWRLYGFSSTLTYAMPIVQSFIACIALYLGFNNKPVYFLAIPALLFSSMINSRFGFLIFFPIAIIQIILIQMKDHRFSQKDISKIILLLTICTLVLFLFIYATIPSTWGWISSSFIDIWNFLNGKMTGYFADTFNSSSSQFVLPTGLSLLFGVGSNIMGGTTGRASDIGFVNDIWIGGIIYSAVLWTMFIVVFSNLVTKSVLHQKNLLVVLLVFMIISNIKGMVITPNELMSCVYVFLAFFILNIKNLE